MSILKLKPQQPFDVIELESTFLKEMSEQIKE